MNSPARTRSVLLVEDEATNQALMKDLLERIDLVPDIANTAEEAFAAIAGKHYDLIIMDVMLPGLSGIEATKQIRSKERETKSHSLIVALTASPEEDIKRRCLEAGMDGYFHKPVKRMQFLEFLKHLLA